MRKTTHARTHGFSLIELLIAITILAILGGVAGLQLIDAPQKARQASAKTQLGTFKTAIIMYMNDNGGPPTSRQGLEALVAKPAGNLPNYNPNGYLDSKAVPKDPWQRDYVYLCPGSNGERFEVVCYGADGEQGGDGYNRDLSTSDAD